MAIDYLVIGSGVAGLSFALESAKHGKVDVITKAEDPQITNTQKAQGGIAVVLSEKDSFDSHIEDTLKAGDYLNDKKVVEAILRKGPQRIEELIKLGARFTKNEKGEYALTKEAAHSFSRIIRAKDMTGMEVQRALFEAANSDPNIRFYTNHSAINLVIKDNKCLGAYVLNKKKNKVKAVEAKVTVLATGGCGKVYLYTSNPDIAAGDGVAMAYRAGTPIANMEFIQFHPTCLYNPEAKNFLISESVRGEGAKLINKNNEEFCNPLAPRDEVARAIDSELKKTGEEYVCLDLRHLGKEFIIKRFPGIHEECLKYKIDITNDLIPVVPAAHYCCGGVKTTTDGETEIGNLFAIGEVACTGLHGANRLASNSLLEGLVVGDNAAKKAAELVKEDYKHKIEPWYSTAKLINSKDEAMLDEASLIDTCWSEIRRFMWNFVGIVRTDKRLERAKHRISNLQEEIKRYYYDFEISPNLIELRNIATVAEIIIDSAMQRKESVGLHYTLTYKDRNEKSEIYNIVRKD